MKLEVKEGYAYKNITTGAITTGGSIFTITPEKYVLCKKVVVDEEEFYVEDSLSEKEQVRDIIRSKYSIEDELDLIHNGGAEYKAFKEWRKKLINNMA